VCSLREHKSDNEGRTAGEALDVAGRCLPGCPASVTTHHAQAPGQAPDPCHLGKKR
jgi:hypothetical protein